MGGKEIHTCFWWANLNEIGHLKDTGLVGMKISKGMICEGVE
jgi:hypothetical protein